jgi:HTH-type transcriptional regulator / antitoxin HipB
MLKKIVEKLKEARKTKGLTQKELSAKMGLPQSHISEIEQGKVDLRVSSLLEISRALDLEPVLVPRSLLSAITDMMSKDPQLKRHAWRVDDDDEIEEIS